MAAASVDEALVEGAPIGLAGEVAGVGVPAVRAWAGHHIGADGHRLGLELLEAPGLALGSGATQPAPTGRGLVRHHALDVLLQRHRVDGAGGPVRVVGRRDGAVHGDVAGAPEAEGEGLGAVVGAGCGDQGTGHVLLLQLPGSGTARRAGPEVPSTDGGDHEGHLIRRERGRRGRRRAPGHRERCARGHDDLIPVVLGHVHPHRGGCHRGQAWSPRSTSRGWSGRASAPAHTPGRPTAPSRVRARSRGPGS